MKKITSHAATAKAIRAELKKLFPYLKFSVTSQTYSMGDSVRVNWTDGVTEETVNKIVRKYQYGSFDGMTDCYDYTNKRDDIPQVKYVQVSRNYSDLVQNMFFEFIKGYYRLDEMKIDDYDQAFARRFDCNTPRNYIYRRLVKTDLSYGLKLDQLS